MNKEKLEEKLGEAIGLEMAAQKAVKELSSKGLLPEESAAKNKLEIVRELTESEGLDSSNIQEMAEETEQKATKMMETYLGEDPDSQEALEFLCLAEGGEVTHYEVLNEMTKDIKDKQMTSKINSILRGTETSTSVYSAGQEECNSIIIIIITIAYFFIYIDYLLKQANGDFHTNNIHIT